MLKPGQMFNPYFLVFRFSFVIALVATQNIITVIHKGLSVKLQGCYVDAIRAHRDIQNVKSTLNKQNVT